MDLVILFLLLPVLVPLLLVLEAAVSAERWAHETLVALRRSRPPTGSGEATGRAGTAASRAPVFLAGDAGILLAIFLLAGLGIALLLWGQGGT